MFCTKIEPKQTNKFASGKSLNFFNILVLKISHVYPENFIVIKAICTTLIRLRKKILLVFSATKKSGIALKVCAYKLTRSHIFVKLIQW